MRKYLVAGNWKMNGSAQSVDELLSGLRQGLQSNQDVDWAVFAPFVYLPQCLQQLAGSGVGCGAQNVSEHEPGAFTGEVSASMLSDLGCQYVLIGHSERRSLYNETNQQVAQKVKISQQYGLKPIICLGETLEQRQAEKTLQIVQEQLAVVLSLQDNPLSLMDAVVAYEPVWAIGTGLQATPEQAQEVHVAIRSQLGEAHADLAQKMRVIYGGSVKPESAKALFAMPDIDGALVGGASLDAKQFLQIGLPCNN